MNNDINLNLVYNHLFTSPEDGSMLYVDKVDTSGKDIVFTTTSLDGKKRFEHVVTIKEIS